MEIGTRVLLKRILNQNVDSNLAKGEIIVTTKSLPGRAKVFFFNRYSVSGRNLCSWHAIDNLEIDLQYYREKKINELLEKNTIG
jgi:hypothetical protein